MAKPYTVRDAKFLLGTEEVGKTQSFSLNASAGLLETTSLGDSVRSFTPGLQTFTGSAEIIYYKQDDGTNDGSEFLRMLVKTGNSGLSDSDSKTLTLRFTDGATNSDVTMTAFITGANISASPGEIAKAQISFQATGELTTATI